MRDLNLLLVSKSTVLSRVLKHWTWPGGSTSQRQPEKTSSDVNKSDFFLFSFKKVYKRSVDSEIGLSQRPDRLLRLVHRSRVSRLQPGCHEPNSPWAGIIQLWRHYSRPGRVWNCNWHLVWGRETREPFFTVKEQSPRTPPPPPRSALDTEEGGMSIAYCPPPLPTFPLFFFLPSSFTSQGKIFSSIFPQIIDMADSIFFVANKKFRNVSQSFTAPLYIDTNSPSKCCVYFTYSWRSRIWPTHGIYFQFQNAPLIIAANICS